MYSYKNVLRPNVIFFKVTTRPTNLDLFERVIRPTNLNICKGMSVLQMGTFSKDYKVPKYRFFKNIQVHFFKGSSEPRKEVFWRIYECPNRGYFQSTIIANKVRYQTNNFRDLLKGLSGPNNYRDHKRGIFIRIIQTTNVNICKVLLDLRMGTYTKDYQAP